MSAPADRAASPFMLTCTPSGHPPFTDLNIVNALLTPCGFSLLGYVLPPPFLEPLLPPVGLNRGPGPFRSQWGIVPLVMFS